MNRIAIVILLLCGCSQAAANVEKSNAAPAKVAVASAVYQNQQSAPVLPDTLARSPESAPEPDVSPTPAKDERKTRLLMLTADWCSVCKGPQQDELNRLQDKGWEVGTEKSNHVQVVDIETENGKAVVREYHLGHAALPKWVLVENGRVVVTAEGFRNAQAINSLRHWGGR